MPYTRAHALSFPGFNVVSVVHLPLYPNGQNVQKPNVFSECRCKGNDNRNVKNTFDSFSSFVSPLKKILFIVYLFSSSFDRFWRYVYGIRYIILCDNHQPDNRRWWEQYERWCVLCMHFDSIVSRAMLILLRM